jgi:hypothetical protein
MIRLLVDEDFNNDISAASAGACLTSMRHVNPPDEYVARAGGGTGPGMPTPASQSDPSCSTAIVFDALFNSGTVAVILMVPSTLDPPSD